MDQPPPAAARRVRISDEEPVVHTIPPTPDAEPQPRRDDVTEEFVSYAEGKGFHVCVVV
jgi:hypothetical protein